VGEDEREKLVDNALATDALIGWEGTRERARNATIRDFATELTQSAVPHAARATIGLRNPAIGIGT